MNGKISDMSEVLLIKLRDTLLEDSKQDSTLVKIKLSEIPIEMTSNEAKICLYYLQDLEYIKDATIDGEDVIQARLHGKGIKYIEDKMNKK